MIKWYHLFLYFFFLQVSAQYSYTYTDPCTLQSKSVFVPAGGGVVVNYFDNHSIFTANDFSSGAFDNWIAQVSQSNSNSPCQSVTTAIVNTVSTAVVSNTVSIVTNVVSISSLAQTMASVMTSASGGALTSTAESISNSNTGGSSDSTNENDSNESTGNNTGGSSTNDNSDQGNTQSQGNQNSVQGSGTNSNNQGGATPAGDSKTKGVASSGNNQAQGGNQEASSPVTPNPQSGSSLEGGSSSGGSGNTANSVSNSIDGGSSDGSSNSSTTETSETKEGKSGGGSNLANSLSNAADGGGSSGGSSTGGGSKKESSAKASTGSLIASGDMVVIANADREQPNQYKFVGSITHANTRGTRIKGILFNYTTVVNNFNVTFYKSYINKSRKLNTVVANSTMVNTAKDIFNTTTALESYKVTKKITGMFGLNATAGKLGERNFYNLSAVVGGHAPIQVTKRVSTSVLVLGIYSPFTQFYEGKWWSAGVLVVPFNSWDFKITKTFKFNISATAVYSYGESCLNYQVLTGGKLNF